MLFQDFSCAQNQVAFFLPCFVLPQDPSLMLGHYVEVGLVVSKTDLPPHIHTVRHLYKALPLKPLRRKNYLYHPAANAKILCFAIKIQESWQHWVSSTPEIMEGC